MGCGGYLLQPPSTEKPVLTQPCAGQSCPPAETSEEGEPISGFLIRLGEVVLQKGGSKEVKVHSE